MIHTLFRRFFHDIVSPWSREADAAVMGKVMGA
jgi:hypothetical protein